MAQHDYVIANGTGAAVRSDLNNALAAIVSQNSGATAPSPTYAYQWWADTTTGLLKLRNAANSGWITLFQLDGEWSTIALENGTAAAPSIYFKDSGTDTGFYSPGTDQVGISTGGTARLTIDSNGNVNIDSNTLYVDAANNRVGLGTSVPGTKLEVNGDILSAGRGTSFGYKLPDCRVFNPSSGAIFAIDDYANTRFLIDSSGRVGIGSTSPQAPFVVSNGGAQGIEMGWSGGSSSNYIQSYNRSTSAFGQLDLIGAPLLFKNGATEAARIDTSSRLLVGTSTQQGDHYLQVQGSATASSYPGSIFLRRGLANASIGSGNQLGVIDFGNQDGGKGATISAEGDAQWGTNDYPSRLVFSTTADGASSPTERTRITNAGAFYHFSTSGDTIAVASTKAAGTTDYFFTGGYSSSGPMNFGTNSVRIYTNGNIQNTNNSYTAISDIKLKENIVDAGSQWADLKALRVRNYNLKEGQTHRQIGLIAQEVELVSPGLVYETPDRDEDGNETGEVTKAVQYSVLYMKAVKALQEAMERIETLEAKVAALEA